MHWLAQIHWAPLGWLLIGKVFYWPISTWLSTSNDQRFIPTGTFKSSCLTSPGADRSLQYGAHWGLACRWHWQLAIRMHQPTSWAVSIMRSFFGTALLNKPTFHQQTGLAPQSGSTDWRSLSTFLMMRFPVMKMPFTPLLNYSAFWGLGFDKAEEKFLWYEIIEWRWLDEVGLAREFACDPIVAL